MHAKYTENVKTTHNCYYEHSRKRLNTGSSNIRILHVQDNFKDCLGNIYYYLQLRKVKFKNIKLPQITQLKVAESEFKLRHDLQA